MSSTIGFVNTEVFRESALYFNKHKRYDDGVPGTIYHKNYWKEERRRCKEGYTSGGVKISGYHYHYLNYCQITITERTYSEVHKNLPGSNIAKVHGDRKDAFPDFWDVDWMFFTCCDIAEYGVGHLDNEGNPVGLTWDQYNNLPIDLHLDSSSGNLGGGHHMLWLKPRGVGFSWKASSMAERNYSCIKGSKTYMLANDKTFLTEDGLWSKYMMMRDWQIANALGLGKGSDYREDRTNMHIEAARKINDKKSGYLSEVIGVSLNNDWQKARGKRGKLALYEEFGKFPNADKAWRVNRRSMEELNVIYGLMLGGGTGGTKDANFEALKAMYWDPKASNLLLFDNVYGENKESGKPVAMFTPAYFSIAYKDVNGNSDTVAAKEYLDNERKIAEQAQDQQTLPAVKAEDPYTPEEAVLVTGKNILISDGLVQHSKKVEALGLYQSIPTSGRFERTKFTLEFKVDLSLQKKAVYKFPHNLNENLEGCVLMYYAPYKKEGIVPDNLYKICVDTYEHDSTTGDSIGSIYVIEQSNNFTSTRGDIIAASFNGRPSTQEEFNKVLFELAEYYNAEIAYENDKPGDVVGYAKRHKKTSYLADEFELAFDENLKTSEKSTRHFGMSMNSGKENKRKKQGDIYTKNWIYTVRSISEEGEVRYNYHAVYDLGLLQEWINYDIDSNRDRQSAWRVGMYHQQELLYNEVVPTQRQVMDSKSVYFARELY